MYEKKNKFPQLLLLTSKHCRFVMVRWMSAIAERNFKSQGEIYRPNGLPLLLLANIYRKVVCQLTWNCFWAINFIFSTFYNPFSILFFTWNSWDIRRTNNPSHPKSSYFCPGVKKPKQPTTKCHHNYFLF